MSDADVKSNFHLPRSWKKSALRSCPSILSRVSAMDFAIKRKSHNVGKRGWRLASRQTSQCPYASRPGFSVSWQLLAQFSKIGWWAFCCLQHEYVLSNELSAEVLLLLKFRWIGTSRATHFASIDFFEHSWESRNYMAFKKDCSVFYFGSFP